MVADLSQQSLEEWVRPGEQLTPGIAERIEGVQADLVEGVPFCSEAVVEGATVSLPNVFVKE